MGESPARFCNPNPTNPPIRHRPQTIHRKIDAKLRTASTDGALTGIHALEYLRRMPGGSQPHLLRCSDGHYYVVKFPNNPQGTRILACDLLGTLLAVQLGLPTQPARVVEVSEDLIRNSQDLVIELPHGSLPCTPGKCFGSRCPVTKIGTVPLMMAAVDWNHENTTLVRNLKDAAGILVFDQWACNTDRRQLLFWRGFQERRWQLSMIDQGNCFNGVHWDFPDSPLWGLYHGLAPYFREGTLVPFEPWLERLEHGIDRKVLEEASHLIPSEWYAADHQALERLLDQLDRRRSRIRELMERSLRSVPKSLFESPWGDSQSFMIKGAGISIVPKFKLKKATA